MISSYSVWVESKGIDVYGPCNFILLVVIALGGRFFFHCFVRKPHVLGQAHQENKDHEQINIDPLRRIYI